MRREDVSYRSAYIKALTYELSLNITSCIPVLYIHLLKAEAFLSLHTSHPRQGPNFPPNDKTIFPTLSGWQSKGMGGMLTWSQCSAEARAHGC